MTMRLFAGTEHRSSDDRSDRSNVRFGLGRKLFETGKAIVASLLERRLERCQCRCWPRRYDSKRLDGRADDQLRQHRKKHLVAQAVAHDMPGAGATRELCSQ